MPDSIHQKGPIDLNVTPKQHKEAWMKQKGSTASKLSSLSFEHYKTAAHNDTLNVYDCMLCRLQLEFGFQPDSWLNIADIEILKRARYLGIDDMRLIQLMHP